MDEQAAGIRRRKAHPHIQVRCTWLQLSRSSRIPADLIRHPMSARTQSAPRVSRDGQASLVRLKPEVFDLLVWCVREMLLSFTGTEVTTAPEWCREIKRLNSYNLFYHQPTIFAGNNMINILLYIPACHMRLIFFTRFWTYSDCLWSWLQGFGIQTLQNNNSCFVLLGAQVSQKQAGLPSGHRSPCYFWRFVWTLTTQFMSS